MIIKVLGTRDGFERLEAALIASNRLEATGSTITRVSWECFLDTPRDVAEEIQSRSSQEAESPKEQESD